MTFKKQRFNLQDVMTRLGVKFAEGDGPFIKFDPKVKPQYRIIRQHSHDGTLLFSNQLLAESMSPLLERTSFYKPEPQPEGMIPIYTIGIISRATVFGRVKLGNGMCPGQRERIRIPVRVDWVPLGT